MRSSPCCASTSCWCPKNAALPKPPTRITASTATPTWSKTPPTPTAPNQRYVSDITYLPTRQGTVYLSLVTDAFSRRIVGHHVHVSLHTAGCLAALARAVRGAGRAVGCLHHSDRGSQYCSDAYQDGLAGRRTALLDDRRLRLLPERAGRTGQRHPQGRIPLRAARRLGPGPLARRPDRTPLQRGRPHSTELLQPQSSPSSTAKSPAGKSERGPCFMPVNF